MGSSGRGGRYRLGAHAELGVRRGEAGVRRGLRLELERALVELGTTGAHGGRARVGQWCC